MKSALLVVDIQNDFLPGGALAVPRGDEVIDVANRMMTRFDLVVATQDWHPQSHGSFAANQNGTIGDVIELNGLQQILWPVHCVWDSPGAAFADSLETDRFHRVFRKGMQVGVDSYSGFFDNGKKHDTGLCDYLRGKGVDRIYILGLATDYCVKFTVLDALSCGFETYLLEDGCRGVELNPGDVSSAVSNMKDAGAHILHSEDLKL